MISQKDTWANAEPSFGTINCLSYYFPTPVPLPLHPFLFLASTQPPESTSTNILRLTELIGTPRARPRVTHLVLSLVPDSAGDYHANGFPGRVTAAPGSSKRGCSFVVSHAHYVHQPIRRWVQPNARPKGGTSGLGCLRGSRASGWGSVQGLSADPTDPPLTLSQSLSAPLFSFSREGERHRRRRTWI